jgi:hypothetical protein
MSDVPVVPEVKEEASSKKSEEKGGVKKLATRKRAVKKPVTKRAVPKVGQSAKKSPAKEAAANPKHKPFPYARVLKMWRAATAEPLARPDIRR